MCISEVGLTQSWKSGRAHQPSFYSAQSSRLRRTEARKAFWDWYANENTRLHTWQLHIPVKWNFFCFESSVETAGDVSVMSTICIPLIFPQKTQDSKPHNVLENHRQSFSSLVSSCLALQLGGSLWHSSAMKCILLAPETGQLQLLPVVHPPGRGKESQREVTKAITSYWTLTLSSKPKLHQGPSS